MRTKAEYEPPPILPILRCSSSPRDKRRKDEWLRDSQGRRLPGAASSRFVVNQPTDPDQVGPRRRQNRPPFLIRSLSARRPPDGDGGRTPQVCVGTEIRAHPGFRCSLEPFQNFGGRLTITTCVVVLLSSVSPKSGCPAVLGVSQD